MPKTHRMRDLPRRPTVIVCYPRRGRQRWIWTLDMHKCLRMTDIKVLEIPCTYPYTVTASVPGCQVFHAELITHDSQEKAIKWICKMFNAPNPLKKRKVKQ